MGLIQPLKAQDLNNVLDKLKQRVSNSSYLSQYDKEVEIQSIDEAMQDEKEYKLLVIQGTLATLARAERKGLPRRSYGMKQKQYDGFSPEYNTDGSIKIQNYSTDWLKNNLNEAAWEMIKKELKW
ncbi:MAG: hypothetical protein AAF696_35900 [Bacteroidota bacterium]